MPDERNARPVSGEIMAAPPAGAEPAEPGFIHADVVDAEFETIRPGRAGCGGAWARPHVDRHGRAPVQGLDSLRKTDAGRRPQGPVRGGPVFWIVGLGLAAGAFWVSGGHALVRQAPFARRNRAGAIRSSMRSISSMSRRASRSMAAVRCCSWTARRSTTIASRERCRGCEIDVTANDGTVLRYNLGTSAEPLAPGAAFGFSSRLEAPKEGVKSVSVTFQE